MFEINDLAGRSSGDNINIALHRASPEGVLKVNPGTSHIKGDDYLILKFLKTFPNQHVDFIKFTHT